MNISRILKEKEMYNRMSLRTSGLGKSLVICLLAGHFGLGQETEPLTALQSTLQKWVETKQLISKEKQKTREQEQMLSSRIELLKLRMQDVQARQEDIARQSGDNSEERASLETENEKLEQAISMLQEQIEPLERRVLALLAAAPEPIRIKLEALSQQIPKDPAQTELSLSLRYQNAIGVLNSLNNFNNEVTLSTEVRQLGTDSAVEVRVLYFGLAQAYFCNKDASIGGTGCPGMDGWKWDRNDEIGPAVAAMIGQYLNERPAGYEAVPVKITMFRSENQ